jgi:HSP20 family protein
MNLIPWKNKGNEMELAGGNSMLHFRNEMDRLFDRFFTQPWSMSSFETNGEMGAFVPSIDLMEEDDEVLVRAEVPGILPKDIDINITNEVLTITGTKKDVTEEKLANTYYAERRFGNFRRSLPLPVGLDVEKAIADYDNGVLTIKLPRSEKARARHIKVAAGKH